jgi:hypothetical protein
MNFLGFLHKSLAHLFMPSLLNLLILARWKFYRYFMVLRDMVHFGILGFEVFGSKIPFLRVLDCHNSPRRVTTRHSELDLQNWRFTRHIEQLLASPAIHSPWRVRQWGNSLFCLLLAGRVFREAVFYVVTLYKSEPLKPRCQWIYILKWITLWRSKY